MPTLVTAYSISLHGIFPSLHVQVVQQQVCLQLARAVESWEPRSETVALHAWLHPWLPYLGNRMEDLYPSIRFKLSTALQQWHPSDQSALALLSPWHTVSPSPYLLFACLPACLLAGLLACLLACLLADWLADLLGTRYPPHCKCLAVVYTIEQVLHSCSGDSPLHTHDLIASSWQAEALCLLTHLPMSQTFFLLPCV